MNIKFAEEDMAQRLALKHYQAARLLNQSCLRAASAVIRCKDKKEALINFMTIKFRTYQQQKKDHKISRMWNQILIY